MTACDWCFDARHHKCRGRDCTCDVCPSLRRRTLKATRARPQPRQFKPTTETRTIPTTAPSQRGSVADSDAIAADVIRVLKRILAKTGQNLDPCV